MSGGSYDYICFSELRDLLWKDETISNMANRLIELSYESLAKETLEYLYFIKRVRTESDVMMKRLSKIWKVVEWLDSGDYGLDTARTILNDISKEEKTHDKK